MTLPDDLARGDVERRKQRGRAVPNVIMRLLGGNPRTHRQQRPGPIQRLHLAFLIETQHQRMVRRIQIQPDNVADFLDKLRVGRQFERIDAMRLQPERLPDSRNGRLREPHRGRHAARGPLRRVGGRAFETAGNHLDEAIIGRLARRPRPRLIQQAIQSSHPEALTPLADTIARHLQAARCSSIRVTLGAGQDDARAERQSLRGLRAARPLLQRPPFVFRQHQGFAMTLSSHAAQRTCTVKKVQGFF